MIGVICVEVQAANPNMPLYPMRAFINSPSSLRIRNVPKKIGDWNITSVQLVAAYPDNSIKSAECRLIGGVWVGTIEGSTATGTSENGYTIYASGIDENGNPVSNYVLGKGLIEILEADGTITPGTESSYVHLLPAQQSTSKDGDLYPANGNYYLWQNGAAHQLGGLSPHDIDTTLTQHNKAAEAYAAGQAISDVNLQVQDIDALIPNQASTSNQLADKAFVNSSVQTATANFRGNWTTWAEVPSTSADYPTDYAGSKTPTVNDYLVVQDASDLSSAYEGTWRFKYSGVWATDGKNGWHPEYQVNETPMTAAQLAAINSGITSALVQQIGNNSYSFVAYDGATDNNVTLHNATNTYIGMDVIPYGVPVNITIAAGESGKMRDMWLAVESYMGDQKIINWPASCKAKDGDAENLETAFEASKHFWTTFMITEKRPGVFMVAREVEEIS